MDKTLKQKKQNFGNLFDNLVTGWVNFLSINTS